MEELNSIRALGMRALAVACAFGALVIWVGTAWSDAGVAPAVAATLVAVLAGALVAQGQNDASARNAMAGAVTVFPMILLYQWAGYPWMIDLHMVFFAALAIIVVLADWRPIMTGAVLIAAHHLAGNFIAPAFVYNGGGDFMRVVLHAVVVIMETAALVMLSGQLENLIVQQAAAKEAKEAAESRAAAERVRVEEEQRVVIGAIGQRLDQLAAGDLTCTITAAFPASYESLKNSFNAATADLNRLVVAVSNATKEINTGSNEIRSASDDLARRTEQQATALEGNASTTRQLTMEIERTATGAEATRIAIAETQQSALAGGNVVSSAVAAMNEIERSATEIGQIITLIDGIAFQTNLLALNAGVEAARAGDAGKGFAVVANEVRALAQRSAEASSSIRSLIQTSGEHVAHGVRLVGQTGEVLGRIVEQISTVSESITEIALAATRQSAELSSVNASFGKLDAVTQQNAAMVEESNAAAHSLSRAAEQLRELVSRFRTSASHEDQYRASPVRRAA